MKITLRTLGMLAVCAAALGTLARPALADKIITAGADKKVKVWDAATGKELAAIDAHEGAVLAMAISPNGKVLATGGADKKVKLWNPADGKLIKEIAAHDKAVTTLWFTLDNEKIFSGSADKKVKVWDATSAKELTAIADTHEGDVLGIIVAPMTIITGGKDNFIRLWGEDGAKMFDIEIDGGLSSMSGNPMEAALYTGGTKGMIKWWTAEKGNGDFAESQGSAVNCMTVTADGKKLISGGADGKVKIWDTDSKKLLDTVDSGHKTGVTAIAVDPKTKVIITAGADGAVKLWDVATKKNLATVENAHKEGVNALIYVADAEKKTDEKKPDTKKEGK